MKGPLLAGVTMLALAALFAVLLTEAGCLDDYGRHARALPVQAEIDTVSKSTVRARRDNRDDSYVLTTLHLRATWQGQTLRRTRAERLGHLPEPKPGDTRRIYVDPENPHADVPGVWPAAFFLLPGVFSVACALGGLLLIVRARRSVEA